MSRHDHFDQPVSLDSAVAVAEWNAMAGAFLAHGASTPDHLARLLDLAPDYGGAHALKGLFLVLLGRRELLADARAALARAEEYEADANPRERDLMLALRHLLDGSPKAAMTALETTLRRAPTDTLAMKLGHALRFVTGDAAGMRRSIERVLPCYGSEHAGHGYLLGCHAFALEETGDYAAATAAGHAALDLAPDDAWGLHAVAHVHDMTADAAGGLDWIDRRQAAWGHCNNFRFHVWWHRALMLLDLGRMDAALACYDEHVRAERTDDYRDIANATSLLLRLELEGIDVGHRWSELADLADARTADGCLVFADLHYLLALTGDGRDAAAGRIVSRLADTARPPEGRHGPGPAAARGLAAFAAGDHAAAFAALSAARPHMQDIGGSHAQRDVFERITIDSGIRAGLLTQAGTILDDRTARRGGCEDRYAAVRRAFIAGAANFPCSRSATA